MSVDEKAPRAYLRDGVLGLTMAEQEAILTGAGVNLTNAYRDELKKAQVKRRDPAELVWRERLLRPTSRATPETVYVASLRVLGWGIADVCRAVAAACARQVSIHACDIDEMFDAAAIPDRLVQALAGADDANKRGARLAGQNAGTAAAAAKRQKKRDALLAKARPLWLQPAGEISAAEIAAQIGVSVRSLHLWLGPREDARKAIKEGKKHR